MHPPLILPMSRRHPVPASGGRVGAAAVGVGEGVAGPPTPSPV